MKVQFVDRSLGSKSEPGSVRLSLVPSIRELLRMQNKKLGRWFSCNLNGHRVSFIAPCSAFVSITNTTQDRKNLSSIGTRLKKKYVLNLELILKSIFRCHDVFFFFYYLHGLKKHSLFAVLWQKCYMLGWFGTFGTNCSAWSSKHGFEYVVYSLWYLEWVKSLEGNKMFEMTHFSLNQIILAYCYLKVFKWLFVGFSMILL